MTQPQARGLYDPRYEHDACGVAFVTRLHGPATHEVVERGVTAIENLYHRGATGADPHTGDGAGLLIQIPDELYRHQLDAKLPPAGRYGVAMCFLPTHDGRRGELEELLERTVVEEGQAVIGWRDVPIEPGRAGETAMKSCPVIRQLFVGAADNLGQDAFERKLFVIRRVAERAAPDLLVASMSSRTVVYKGMLTSLQLADFFPDLRNGRCRTRMALAHSRFSTNTFPSWELAHPYRMIAHNGEINTLMGNVNWMRARESQLYSSLFGAEDLEKLLPIVRPGLSDSATFDSVMELLVMAGRTLPHAAMMMIPAAWQSNPELPEDLRDFYAYHSCLMESWDGPAAVCFSDGRTVGATLDRNGLRPGRWILTKSGDVLLASEAGVLPVRERDVEVKGRLQPGKLFVVDLERNRVFANREAERKVAAAKPYGKWYRDNILHISDLPERPPRVPRTEPLRARQLAFGFSQEDLRVILGPMARDAAEPTASMGNDAALAVLSDKQPPVFNYFKQLFAQVTNPPIDPIRESVVMDISAAIGPVRNLFDETPEPRAPAAHGPPVPAQPPAREGAPRRPRDLQDEHDRHHVAGRRGRRGDAGGAGPRLRRGGRRHQRGRADPRALRPQRRHRSRPGPVAARDRRRPPSPRALGHPPARRPDHRVRRAARRPPHGHAHRLRRERDQPVPDVRVDRRARRRQQAARGHVDRGVRAARRQGPEQGPDEDPLQDGDLDDQLVLRGADLRVRRARPGRRRPLLHRHLVAHRRRRPRRHRPRDARPPRARLPGEQERHAARRRRVPVAPRRRVPRLEPGHDRAAPARRARQRKTRG